MPAGSGARPQPRRAAAGPESWDMASLSRLVGTRESAAPSNKKTCDNLLIMSRLPALRRPGSDAAGTRDSCHRRRGHRRKYRRYCCSSLSGGLSSYLSAAAPLARAGIMISSAGPESRVPRPPGVPSESGGCGPGPAAAEARYPGQRAPCRSEPDDDIQAVTVTSTVTVMMVRASRRVRRPPPPWRRAASNLKPRAWTTTFR